MKRIRYGLIIIGILSCLVTSATAGVSIGIGLPNVSIGINLPLFPQLVVVPGYPVYYAPQVDANYFFYDGMYWVYQNDNWYASSWYNGPWGIVQPYYVPLYILRIPVRYYRQPPPYFQGWQSNAPPRWGQHWGRDWEQRRGGWDKWKRGSAPAPAPLPAYQRQYSGDRYPKVEQQHTLRSQQYRYQPRDKVVREHFKQAEQKAPAPAQRGRQEAAPVRSQLQQEPQRQTPLQKGAPAGPQTQPPQRGGEHVQKSAPPAQPAPQQRAPAVREQKQASPPAHDQKQQPGGAQKEQQSPRQQERGDAQGGHGQGQGQRNDEERGQGRNR
jgi:hypothetical protein